MPEAPLNLALFDIDGTLLPLDSDYGFCEFLVGLGWVDAEEQRRANEAFYADYQAGCLDVHAYVRFATRALQTRPVAEVQEAMERYMVAVIEPAVTPQALDLVARHREAGDVLAAVTSTHSLITTPIAKRFGIPTLLATELEQDALGRPTGAIKGVPCLREGKVTRVEQWLVAQGRGWADIARSHYYGDSMNDVPLLERVTHPVATNPSPSLAALAATRGWKCLNLFVNEE